MDRIGHETQRLWVESKSSALCDGETIRLLNDINCRFL